MITQTIMNLSFCIPGSFCHTGFVLLGTVSVTSWEGAIVNSLLCNQTLLKHRRTFGGNYSWFRDIFRIARLYVQSYSTPVVSLLSLHYNVLPGEKTRAVICELCHLASGILQTETNACYTPAAFSTPEELAKKKREIWKARENCKYCT